MHEKIKIKILKGVRQGDPLSPKLFTATIQDAFRKIELEERGLNIDGENLSELRFADDIDNNNSQKYGGAFKNDK